MFLTAAGRTAAIFLPTVMPGGLTSVSSRAESFLRLYQPWRSRLGFGETAKWFLRLRRSF